MVYAIGSHRDFALPFHGDLDEDLTGRYKLWSEGLNLDTVNQTVCCRVFFASGYIKPYIKVPTSTKPKPFLLPRNWKHFAGRCFHPPWMDSALRRGGALQRSPPRGLDAGLRGGRRPAARRTRRPGRGRRVLRAVDRRLRPRRRGGSSHGPTAAIGGRLKRASW